VPPGSDGAGQTIGLIELGGGYREEDLNTFFRQMNLRPPRVFSVSVGGARNQPTGSGADGEVTSNIEVAGAIAPKANIVVYFAPNTDTGFAEAIKAAAHDITHKPSIISITWGAAEVNWTEQVRTGLDAALAAAARQGITIVAAAGDNGVTDGVDDGKPHVDFPASSQWVLAVGGTSLVANGGEIASETVWSSGGGGISDVTALPDWQAGANVPLRKDGSRGRGVPDVAAAADPSHGYLAFVGGKQVVFGGTALAAPLWAGLIATINQSLGRNVGYFNRRLYTEIGPANVLRSITIGTNGNGSLQGYSAGPGWNPVAGWGAPDAEKLLMWLREHPG
jgi:kumamolisin